MNLYISLLYKTIFTRQKLLLFTRNYLSIIMSQGEKLGYRIHVTVCAWREIGQGCWWMCRWVGVTLLHMCKGSSCLKGEADVCDIIRWHHCCSAYINEGVVFKKAHTSLGALIWSLVLGLFGTTSFLGSHRPSVLATLVPLEEWEYNYTGKFSLFVQLYMLRVILNILS